jgi:tRNA nucleotidyltransferase (CCA-adding enzyme)
MDNPNLIEKFSNTLPPDARNLLDELLRIAEPKGPSVYLVGGPLRDLFLDRPLLDIDIAVEGDAMALALELAKATDGRALTHPAFLTATVRIPGHHMDLITARSETYARPGALPTVRPATIREDLLRRDFTVNALALRLSGPGAGEILDPARGQRDLDAKLIRVLHERSFQDDATRILRAFRYATRLGFEIEPETLAWLKRDLSYLETISGARIHREFAGILAEDATEEILLRLDEGGTLAAIHPDLRFEREYAQAFARLRDLHQPATRAAYWPVLAWHLTEAEAADLARRLSLRRTQRVAVEAMPTLEALVAQHLQVRLPSRKRSTLAELLSPFPVPTLWAFAALTDDASIRDRLLDYLTKARQERPHLTGDDLLALGVAAGPSLGHIFRRLRNARLDGETTTREDEKRLARRLIVASENADHHARKAAPSRSS